MRGDRGNHVQPQLLVSEMRLSTNLYLHSLDYLHCSHQIPKKCLLLSGFEPMSLASF